MERADEKEIRARFPETHLLDNGIWRVLLSSYGGQIIGVSHHSSPHDVIFLGSKADWKNRQSIRGGVPICWPWFGASPVPGRPIQGFARTAMWQCAALNQDLIRLQLPPAAVGPGIADFPFELFSEIRLTDALEMTLSMKNCGETEQLISCALHTYFAVSCCEEVTVTGLEHSPFTVKGGPVQQPEEKPLQIRGEVCRLYAPQTGEVTLHDPLWQRKIVISKENSGSTLVWNPGAERCRAISDLEDGEYRNFLCIECNRAGEDSLTLLPGKEYRITQKIRMEHL